MTKENANVMFWKDEAAREQAKSSDEVLAQSPLRELDALEALVVSGGLTYVPGGVELVPVNPGDGVPNTGHKTGYEM